MNPNIEKKLIARHKHMVDDPRRTPLIKKAIKQNIKRGDVAFEIGSGTGILTLEALKAGAKIIYSCEIDRVIEIARKTIKQNGFEHQAVFFKGLSVDFDIPEKADILIAETVGSLGFNENILFYLIEARDRILKKSGIIIPAAISLFLAPTDFQPTGKQDIQSFQIHTIPKQAIKSQPKQFYSAVLKSTKDVGFDSEYSFSFDSSYTLTGMACWVLVEWAKGLVTDASPYCPPTHWKQCFLPFAKPISVKKNESLLFRLIVGPDEENPLEATIEWGYLKSE